MAPSSEDKVALVTGAGRGIGRAIAVELGRAGFSLCLAARTREQLEGTRALTGLTPGRSLIVLIDLAGEEAPDDLFGAIMDHFGRLDVLINNAGWAPPRVAISKINAADQDRIIAVNLRAPVALTRLAAPQMARQPGGGVIVNIASASARNTPAGEAVYAAAKAGIIAFTRACFADFRQQGIRTCVVVPGLTDTSLIPPNKRLDRTRMLSPERIAAAVMSAVRSPDDTCVAEIVIEPARDPLSGVR